MPEIILPATFLALLAEFRSVFTAPSYTNFRVLVCGFLHAVGKHRVTDAIRAAGASACKHYSVYFRFFSRSRWSLDEFGLLLLGLVVRLFRLQELELVVDDTLTRRTGKKVALATMHADPLLKYKGRPFISYGHVFVVLAVHVSVPFWPTGWALPIMFRLYRGTKHGGRKDSPSDRRRKRARRIAGKALRVRERKTDESFIDGKVLRGDAVEDTRKPLPKKARRTKLQDAAEMILLVAGRFPHLRIRVIADHLYNGRAVLKTIHEGATNVSMIVRGRKDAALYELPPPPTGRRGRPRTKGKRLPNPETWAAQNPSSFERVTLPMYGRQVEVLVASYLGMAYRSLPGRLVRYIIVKDPAGIYSPDYYICTDLDLSAADALRIYCHRWPIERTFQDCKQKLGIEDPEVQLPRSVRRCVPFGMLLYSLVMVWYLTSGLDLTSKLPQHSDPWYAKTGRPSFTEILAQFRRLAWAEPFLDPPADGLPRQKILAEYLERVVATA